ncbi:hypothetical protein Tco_1217830 [Tanacetum coccineum]
MPILHSFKENKLEYEDEDEVEIKMMGTVMDKESLEHNLYENDITLIIFLRSLNLSLVCLYRLCHLAIFCLDQHAYTLHHLESLPTISLDNLYLNSLDIFKEDLEYQSLRKSLSLILELS